MTEMCFKMLFNHGKGCGKIQGAAKKYPLKKFMAIFPERLKIFK